MCRDAVFYDVNLDSFLYRLELEDLEMKHNSAIKQLMREFNTHMALKEKELDSSVKETIGEIN